MNSEISKVLMRIPETILDITERTPKPIPDSLTELQIPTTLFRNMEAILKYLKESKEIDSQKEIALKRLELMEKELNITLSQTFKERNTMIEQAVELMRHGVNNSNIEQVLLGVTIFKSILENPVRR